MKYKIACVGKIKEDYFTKLICEVPDERTPQKNGDRVNSIILNAEAARLKNVIAPEDYVIVLCINGKKMSTADLTEQVRKAEERDQRTVTFVIGGSLGLANDIMKLADYKMSVSDMTFPHQLMRVALTEQIMIVSEYLHKSS